MILVSLFVNRITHKVMDEFLSKVLEEVGLGKRDETLSFGIWDFFHCIFIVHCTVILAMIDGQT